MLRSASYDEVRGQILPGDIIAYSGKGFSSLIKRFLRNAVSHNGIVIARDTVVESNAPDGVARWRLSERVEKYDGEVWWLPLSAASRLKLDALAMAEWLVRQIGKPYDYHQALGSGLDWLGDAVIRVHEDYARQFCSELAAGAHEKGHLYSLNAAEVTPPDLCSFRIYAPDYFQLKGAQRTIKGYNLAEPNGFGGG